MLSQIKILVPLAALFRNTGLRLTLGSAGSSCMDRKGHCVHGRILCTVPATSKTRPWMELSSALGQCSWTGRGRGAVPPRGSLQGTCFLDFKEIKDHTWYLKGKHSFIPFTLWGLFWEKQGSLDKVIIRKNGEPCCPWVISYSLCERPLWKGEKMK